MGQRREGLGHIGAGGAHLDAQGALAGGQVQAGPRGLPVPGQGVRRGEVLAYAEQARPNQFKVSELHVQYDPTGREPEAVTIHYWIGSNRKFNDSYVDLSYNLNPKGQVQPIARSAVTLRALEAGKHVLVEKAFTMDAAEARELAEIAVRENRFLMEAMWTKFQPLHNEIKRLLATGRIGNLKMIESSFGLNLPFDNNQRLFNFEQGGGSALDQGVYTHAFAHWFAGSPLKKQTSIGELFSNGADASVHSVLEYENGVLGLALSSLVATLGFGARLVGDAGSITFEGTFWSSEAAVIDGPVDGKEHPVERIECPRRGAGYVHMIEAVSSAILAGKIECEQHPLNFTIEIMEQLDEARRQINGAR